MADRRATFITTYLPYAQEASALTGIDPGVILAQAAHETGWGRKAPGNNFFGIKGGGQTFATHEYIGGKRVNMKAGFRRYDDPRGSFLDWAKLMQTPRYAKVLAAKTPEEQIKALKEAGYATDPAYVSKLNNVRSQVAGIAGDALTAPAQTGVGGIMDVASLNQAPSSVPDQPTAAQGYAPVLNPPSAAHAAISDMLGQPEMTADQIDQMTMVDANGNYLNPPGLPPMPQPPPQWAQTTGFPIDEALSGRSAQDVLTGGPRMDPRRSGPASGPMPPDMGAMRSPADVLSAGPRLDPRRAIGSGPVGPTTPQGVLDMGPRPRPPGPEVPMPTPPMRPDNFVWNGGGAPGNPPMPPSNPRRASALPDQPEVLKAAADAASKPFTLEPWQKDAVRQFDAQRHAPLASSFPPRPEPVAPTGLPSASRSGDLSAAMGGPPAPPLPPTLDPSAQDARMAEFEAGMASDRLARDLYTRRREMEQYVPDYRTGPAPTMGERFDTAAPYPNAEQMFSLPGLNGASFPAPPPVVGTAEAGSTTGEFFTPAPPMPQPPPDPLAGRFDDAFSPPAPGMVMDLQGTFNAQQGRPPPGMTAQDGINSVFGAPPAPAAVPNMAIPFAEVPGIGPSPAEAATVASPLPSPAMPAPQPISQQQFDERFGGGTVVPPPQPGQPGVVSGEMPTPAGAMDIRSPAQGGPGMPPAPAMPAPPPPPQPPRQPNPGAERQRNGVIGRVLGGLLGGPIGALGGGLLGGGGGGFGFGGQPSFAWSGGGGSAPYGNNGSTTYQKGTSNALGGSNALSWKGSQGQQVTVVQDPWTGTYYGPTSAGGMY